MLKPTFHKTTLLFAVIALGGCTSTSEMASADATENQPAPKEKSSFFDFKLEPWVKPYERSNLADPIMAIGRNPIAAAYAKHISESREGARGADGGAGGGCGCN